MQGILKIKLMICSKAMCNVIYIDRYVSLLLINYIHPIIIICIIMHGMCYNIISLSHPLLLEKMYVVNKKEGSVYKVCLLVMF